MFQKLIRDIEEKHLIKRYAYLLLALFVSAISYNLLIYPTKIVAGGTNGMSILIESIFNVKPSIFILIFSAIILAISLSVLGIEKSSGAFVATFLYPLFVDLTSGITSIMSLDNQDMILISLFIGLINGWTSGMIYKMGFSSGGISLINQMLYEKLHISISKSNFFINMIIVILGGIYFRIENIMYAVIILFVSGIVIDKVLLGISNNKVFYIITSKEKEVKEYILKEMGHGITEFDVVSGYLEHKGKALMTVIPTRKYFRVTEGIKKIDEHAFFVVTDSYQMTNGA